jgi:hypothetical protein
MATFDRDGSSNKIILYLNGATVVETCLENHFAGLRRFKYNPIGKFA